MNARYLLRLDDACAGMHDRRWARIEQLFDELAIKPIVAIVPDNRDPELDHGELLDDFWTQARGWQEKGWAIALHGYQHIMHPVAVTTPQYLPFHDRSEFVGLSLDQQAEKMRQGLAVMAQHGVMPTMWVAPAHAFDRVTVEALLRETKIRMVSDGIARDQYFEDGIHWLPQTLWSLADKSGGLWTVCLHPSTMGDAEFDRLEAQLRGAFAGRVTSVDEVVLHTRPRSFADRIEAFRFWQRHRIGRGKLWLKQRLGR